MGAAALATLATTVKIGTALNVIVVVEAALVPVAVVGALALWHRRDWLRWVPVTAAALLAVQTVSLVSGPEHPGLFLRPGSANAWARVPQRVVALETVLPCGRDAAYGGPPLLAFKLHLRVRGDQPDVFLILGSETLRRRYGSVLVSGGCAP